MYSLLENQWIPLIGSQATDQIEPFLPFSMGIVLEPGAFLELKEEKLIASAQSTGL